MDNSVIDISGESYNLSNISRNSNVPYWRHQQVYSFSEINSATNQQRVFYKTFKFNFLGGIYTDLDGNTNYAFVLLFDLLKEFDNHKNVARLERELKELKVNYPKTKTYCVSHFIKKLEEHNLREESERIRRQENYYDDYSGYDQQKLGFQFRAKLNLNDEDAALLNKIWNPANNFFNIEFCAIEIIKFYLSVIKRLDERCKKDSSSLNEELSKIADTIAQKHYNYKPGSSNYKYSKDTVVGELHSNIFKYCENTVRDSFGHKRKLNTDLQYISNTVKEEYEERIITRLNKVVQIYAPTINDPDESTDYELNIQNTTRWKIKFDEFTNKFNKDSEKFINQIISLGVSNRDNPSVENVFYDASKFIAVHNKEAALTLYVYYIHYYLKSVKFDHKPLGLAVQKTLFKNGDQFDDFQAVINQFIQDKDLEKALKAVQNVYTARRKKIQLDRDAIQQVHEKHSGTVELLNEYLRDEDEHEDLKTELVINPELEKQVVSKNNSIDVSLYDSLLNFTKIQQDILDSFSKANFSVLQTDFEAFAKSKGMFKNQLIESINEICYETLDDVLIEEEDDFYIINENYYNRILAK
ncbi:tellurite resistance TerB C-terminal domain-containing protein [Flavobacterium procerum]|uniref:Tellurite resistance TerB C-terminal domain-containing protein n=1 Tax=Flavobacterium procerum TaxID=1455569 RepID=A0ABV6C078_9FLAO